MVVSPSNSSERSHHVQFVSQAQETSVPLDDDVDDESLPVSSRVDLSEKHRECIAHGKQSGHQTSAQDVCLHDNDGDDDMCSECEVLTPRGSSGHVFWDEVEMMRHGWCDKYGHHWNKTSLPEDEAELLHKGVVSRDCRHQSQAEESAIVSSPPPASSDTAPHVRFVDQLHPSQSFLKNLATMDKHISAEMPQMYEETIAIEGGGTLTKVGVDREHRLYNLRLGPRRVFLERGLHAHLVVLNDATVRRTHASI